MIAIEEIKRAQQTLAGRVVRTPLVRLHASDVHAEIYLKLENLQPIGSFKLRGALNAVANADPREVARGLVTASSGNMAQGVAWAARTVGVPCTVLVPDTAPAMKLAAVERLGARTVSVTFERWWQAIEDSRVDGVEGLFIHPIQDDHVLAGNGTIGLEILEDVPEPDCVVVPWGGGGLTVGIASAIKTLSPATRVVAAEPESGAPLTPSLAAGSPQAVEYRPSFVDGAGGRVVLPKIWSHVRDLVDEAVVVPLDEVAAAVRLLAERARIVAEGAGGLAFAAVLSGRVDVRRAVCVVSGGNIDAARLARILSGATP